MMFVYNVEHELSCVLQPFLPKIIALSNSLLEGGNGRCEVPVGGLWLMG